MEKDFKSLIDEISKGLVKLSKSQKEKYNEQSKKNMKAFFKEGVIFEQYEYGASVS